MEPRSFRTTRWSVVLASHDSEPQRARRALGELATLYWFPLWAFARRSGLDSDAATDAVQEFFARVIEHSSLASATPERGRFRSYLRTAFRHFLVNEAERARAVKRGGGVATLSIDEASADARYERESVNSETPETSFDRAWARTLLERVVDGLAEEFEVRGDRERFDELRGLFLGTSQESYADVAARLGMTEGACKVAVHRLRKRYKALLTAEIAETLEDPGGVSEELAYLFRALSRA